MNMKKLPVLAGLTLIGAALVGPQALASNVTVSGTTDVLSFGGQVNATNINTFFDGGTDAFGTAGGTANNVGVTFSSPGEFLNAGFNGSGTRGGTGEFENVPSGASGVLFFATNATAAVLDDAGGFSAINFNFSLQNNTVSNSPTVSFWSGVNGTGTELGSLALYASTSPIACTSSHDQFCTWSNVSPLLSGIAESIVFSGGATGNAEYDAIGLTPAPVPLPAPLWLMLSGLGSLLGFVRRRAA